MGEETELGLGGEEMGKLAEGAMATAHPACLGLTLSGAAEAAVALLGAGSRALCQTLSWLLEVLGCSLSEQRATHPPAFAGVAWRGAFLSLESPPRGIQFPRA